ncbi:hypothetical protein PCH_Pc18g06460 [Penicillium rubens Wisconsin 54-1255]|uniref:Uncharacterized protein n=1 Tax=Penicillium rubens (strain ATCC 28089 / DSM 1075 / NRRL 1951 / Wisconsin 54-1255) TaxID=500485 RepID=B6HCR9_PENRW|nr:hypothetical protein PCH_Pc18g06460 [Penicillium rubens Wisconsin 54-1255]
MWNNLGVFRAADKFHIPCYEIWNYELNRAINGERSRTTGQEQPAKNRVRGLNRRVAQQHLTSETSIYCVEDNSSVTADLQQSARMRRDSASHPRGWGLNVGLQPWNSDLIVSIWGSSEAGTEHDFRMRVPGIVLPMIGIREWFEKERAKVFAMATFLAGAIDFSHRWKVDRLGCKIVRPGGGETDCDPSSMQVRTGGDGICVRPQVPINQDCVKVSIQKQGFRLRAGRGSPEPMNEVNEAYVEATIVSKEDKKEWGAN